MNPVLTCAKTGRSPLGARARLGAGSLWNPPQRLRPDVLPVVHPFKLKLVDPRVGALDGGRQILGNGGYSHDAPAGGQ